jgi:drug/metabolite transporter (DMT)-like permease
MLRVVVAMAVAGGSAAFGQILVRRGMQQVGSLENYAPLALVSYFWQALTNAYVIGGTVFNAIFYFLFLAALSWTDVTVVLPMSALEYLFAAGLAIVMLNEKVTALRWAGIVLIVIGVILIARTGGET